MFTPQVPRTARAGSERRTPLCSPTCMAGSVNCCLPRYTGRNMGQKQSSLDFNLCYNLGCPCHKQLNPQCLQCWLLNKNLKGAIIAGAELEPFRKERTGALWGLDLVPARECKSPVALSMRVHLQSFFESLQSSFLGPGTQS